VKRLVYIYKWLSCAGWQGTVAYAEYKFRNALGFPGPSTSTVTLRPRGTLHPVVARRGSASDMDVFRQIFPSDEYACMRRISSPGLILDLGANVGYSSAYFLNCFPAAKVVAIEPDPQNYKLCRTNLAPYGERVRLVLGAAWSKRTKLVLSRGTWGDGRQWASQVVAGDVRDDSAVEAWDIASLLEMSGDEQIDILKVDIERSELEVFGKTSSSWLSKVRNICIELHGADCEKVFFDALSEFQYDVEHSGELTICLNMQKRQ
jgi:FkbM family methyltransferase